LGENVAGCVKRLTLQLTLMLDEVLIGAVDILAAIGIGSALARWLRISPGLGERGILGLIGLVGAGAVTQLFFPLSGLVQVVFVAFGILIAIVHRRQIRDASTWPALISLAAGFVAVAWVWRSAPLSYDDGLYYLQTIKWLRQFPVTIGLANLHGRLGFNSQDFVLLATLPAGGSAWVARSALSGLVIASFVQRLDGLRAATPWRPEVFWYAVLAPLVFVTNPVHELSGPDFLCVALLTYWFLIALQVSPGADGSNTDYALLVIIGTCAPTVKLSAAPIVALTLLGAALAWKSGWVQKRVLGLSAFLFGVWLLRGVLLSGCALYPVRQSCIFALPWAVKPEQVTWHSIAIQSWARSPGVFDYHAVLSSWDWFQPWCSAVLKEPIFRFGAVGAVAFLLSPLGLLIHGSRHLRAYALAGFLAVCITGWFFSAPDVRFGAGFLISFGLLGVSLLASLALPAPRILRYGSVVLPAFVVAAGIYAVVRAEPLQASTPPVVESYELRTPSEPRVWIPRRGELCWDHALPCSPYIHVDSWRRVWWPRSLPSFPESSFNAPPDWIGYGAEDSRTRPAMRVPAYHREPAR
jgi:hypothetical protein